MASNGCGGVGGISTAWRWLFRQPPPWEACCDYHDLAYEQGGDEATRLWADNLLRDCMIKQDYEKRAQAYWLAVRAFGWIFWPYDKK